MSSQRPASSPDFIRLDGETIRVTSWHRDEATNAYRLVAITRGSRDAGSLDGLLRRGRVTLEREGTSPTPVTIASVDRREFGTGQALVTRFAVTLDEQKPKEPTGTSPDDSSGPSLEDRVAALEHQVSRLTAELGAIRDRAEAD